MHSLLARVNNLSAFLFTVLGVAVLAVFAQTYFLNYSTPVNIEVANVRIKQVNDYAAPYGRSDLASLYFNLHADLSPVFNWNVKQLYVFLVAKYSTPERAGNQITLWDKYFMRFENNVINEQNVAPLFYFADDGTNLINNNVTYLLRWTVVPNAGWMRNVDGGGEVIIPMPKSYNW